MSRSANHLPLYGSDLSHETQRQAFVSGRVPVAVYGLGKMGLPLAATFAEISGNVIGADIDPKVVESVNRGESHISREPELDELVAETVGEGSLRAIDDPKVAAEKALLHVIIVPTLLTSSNKPDLSIVEAVARDIADGLSPGDVVLVECTLPPGTCRDLLVPLLSDGSGIDPGRFGVAFCPERTRSGDALKNIRGSYPKIIGGHDRESERVANLVYSEITDNVIIPVSDTTTAEAVKIFEGVYRDVNIALANELAKFVDATNIDVRAAIEAANTQPLCDIHDPGPGVGGHCIPYYPYFLLNSSDVGPGVGELIGLAREINDGMPEYTVSILEREMAETNRPIDGSSVVILGMTYRPGVNETRKSPAHGIAEHLHERGATVYAIDPILSDQEIRNTFPAEPISIENSYSYDIDAIVVNTAHSEFDDIEWSAYDDLVIIDGRDALNIDGSTHHVYTIGRGRK